jgi:GNAT superfamily N-acetyltransferase
VAEIFEDPASPMLFEEYSKECANPLLGVTAPNRAHYEALGDFAQCFAVHYVDGVLCGFAMVIAAVVPHYGRMSATVESLYVAKYARRGGLGRELMDAMESHCRQIGCTAIFYSAPVGGRLARLLFLDSDRYTNTNHVFCRRLT